MELARVDEIRGAYPTLAITDHIASLVAKGVPLPKAARAVGVRPSKLGEWMERGRNEVTGDYRRFVRAVEIAQGKFIEEKLESIDASGSKDWRAHAWLLERLYPQQFSSSKQEIAALRKQLKLTQDKLAEVLGLTLPPRSDDSELDLDALDIKVIPKPEEPDEPA